MVIANIGFTIGVRFSGRASDAVQTVNFGLEVGFGDSLHDVSFTGYGLQMVADAHPIARWGYRLGYQPWDLIAARKMAYLRRWADAISKHQKAMWRFSQLTSAFD
jgi:hypothetical protein